MSEENTTPTDIGVIDIAKIMHAIPHRYPFLLVDRVVDLVKDESCIGIKNVTINENFFQGHFPTMPVMPGVLIIECMAQTAAVLVVETLGPDSAGKLVYFMTAVLVVETLGPDSAGKLVYFMTIDNAKFRKPVVPGDQMRVHVKKERQRGNIWKFSAEAKVDGKVVAEATYAAMILDR